MAERTEYRPGDFCWVGLATSDPATAKDFYTRLFGWEAEDVAEGAFTLLRLGGADVAIVYLQTEEARAARVRPHWTSFISVEDADATAARAAELGGTAVFREPFDVLDDGRIAAIRDPAGAIVSLWQPRSRQGATVVNDVGAWCWNELATPDPHGARRFYADLLGWDYEERASDYTVILHDGHGNGGIRPQTEQERGTPPDWVPYFTVASADDAVETAERLGGRALVAGTEIAVGRFSAAADPQGAVFCLFEGATDP